MKMATGSGKTTVMAMLIAWQTVNAVRKPTSSDFTRGFLIVTPGITIRDRLRVLLPSEPDNYYRDPRDRAAGHAAATSAAPRSSSPTTTPSSTARRWRCPRSAARFLQGNAAEPLKTTETEGADAAARLRQAAGTEDASSSSTTRRIIATAHKVGSRRRRTLTGRGEGGGQEEQGGRAALDHRHRGARSASVGVRAVYDLSATPFFLRGSGYRRGHAVPLGGQRFLA